MDFLPPFQPFPFLKNGHLQTVLGTFSRPARRSPRPRQTLVPLPDGDALVLHVSTPSSWLRDHPTVVLVHGLGGCHLSAYMTRVANLLAARGLRTINLDLRGAGAGAGHAGRLYNAGCSADVRRVLDQCQAQAPASPLALIGFSMGGNIVLKLAGELADHPLPSLKAVAAVAPPIDLARCSLLLQRFPFYDRFFVRHLLAQVKRMEERNPLLTPVRFPRGLSLRQFDDLYTAPRHGFQGVADYYHRASSLPFISRIQVPTLMLTARDDPFICAASIENLPPLPALETRIVPHGGHLGFLGWDGHGGVRWGERLVANWVWQRLGAGEWLRSPPASR